VVRSKHALLVYNRIFCNDVDFEIYQLDFDLETSLWPFEYEVALSLVDPG